MARLKKNCWDVISSRARILFDADPGDDESGSEAMVNDHDDDRYLATLAIVKQELMFIMSGEESIRASDLGSLAWKIAEHAGATVDAWEW